MPFLTEELWHRLPQPAGARSIALDKFPEPRANWADAAADEAMATLQEIVIAARNIRAEMKLDPKRKVAADFWIDWSDAPQTRREKIWTRFCAWRRFRACRFRLAISIPPARPFARPRRLICASPMATRWTSPPKSRA